MLHHIQCLCSFQRPSTDGFWPSSPFSKVGQDRSSHFHVLNHSCFFHCHITLTFCLPFPFLKTYMITLALSRQFRVISVKCVSSILPTEILWHIIQQILSFQGLWHEHFCKDGMDIILFPTHSLQNRLETTLLLFGHL